MKIKNVFLFSLTFIIMLFLHIYFLKYFTIDISNYSIVDKNKESTIALKYIRLKKQIPEESPLVNKTVKNTLPQKSKLKNKPLKKDKPIKKKIVNHKSKAKLETKKSLVHQKKTEIFQQVNKSVDVVNNKKMVQKNLMEKNEKRITLHERKKIQSNYLKAIYQTIQNNKLYPKRAKRMRQEGQCKVHVEIQKSGNISNVTFIKKSAYSILNKACINIFNQIKSFEPIPKMLKLEKLNLDVPLKYRLL